MYAFFSCSCWHASLEVGKTAAISTSCVILYFKGFLTSGFPFLLTQYQRLIHGSLGGLNSETIVPAHHVRLKLLEIIPEALFEAEASASTRLYAFDLCRALTKDLTAVELFDFAESFLPQQGFQSLRAFANNLILSCSCPLSIRVRREMDSDSDIEAGSGHSMADSESSRTPSQHTLPTDAEEYEAERAAEFEEDTRRVSRNMIFLHLETVQLQQGKGRRQVSGICG